MMADGRSQGGGKAGDGWISRGVSVYLQRPMPAHRETGSALVHNFYKVVFVTHWYILGDV